MTTEGERQKAAQIKRQATTIRKLKDNQTALLDAFRATRARPGHYHGCIHPDTPCTNGCKIIRAAIAKATSP